ncbi:MAG: hypothetical protein Kow0025_20380 [Thermodesulfovibrionales bacterium]
MSLRTKITLGFSLSAFIIAVLSAFVYINFAGIKREIRFLEVTDTIRSKSLQLRRHEKNFFLYPAKAGEESAQIYGYLVELDAIAEGLAGDSPAEASALREMLAEYRRTFAGIESLAVEIAEGFALLRPRFPDYSRVFSLMETNFLDRPLRDAGFLEDALSLPRDHPLVRGLRELDARISRLRQVGENLIAVSKDLDRAARGNAERGIRVSQTAIVVVFPIFVLTGLGVLFVIGGSVVKRLKALIRLVEKAGERYVPGAPATAEAGAGKDEVAVLEEKFAEMEDQIRRWEGEVERKNQELLQSKKLSAIGTLASGVAHELNNPLNNIYVSAQVLRKEMGPECPPFVRDIVEDIAGQTARVKSIVGDLLEFARGREPSLRPVELGGLIAGAYELAAKATGASRVSFGLEVPHGLTVRADREQLERVFINLFTNAIDAMEGEGELRVRAAREDGAVRIEVSDTGKGMGEEEVERVFDPFFTTKDKGTGLGLAIVLNTITRHGGEISVESAPGRGAAFTIRLPGGGD